jgi:hypothetical protein
MLSIALRAAGHAVASAAGVKRHRHEESDDWDQPRDRKPPGSRRRGGKADPDADHGRQRNLGGTRDVHEGGQGVDDQHHQGRRDDHADEIEHVARPSGLNARLRRGALVRWIECECAS